MPSAKKNIHTDLKAVDELLAGVGLKHGRRLLMSAGFERQPKHPMQQAKPKGSRAAVKEAGPAVVQSPLFQQPPWLLHGFSTRVGGASTAYSSDRHTGELNLGFTSADTVRNVTANRKTLVRMVAGTRRGSSPKLLTINQIHSSMTRLVRPEDAARTLKGDGMMTGEAGLLLGIQTADCIPVLVADRRTRAVAAFHAGWRGTLKRIVEGGIGRMRLEFGSRPEDLIAAIGPGIGQCCYSVGEEVRSEFESQFEYASKLFRDVYDSDPIKEKYPLLFLTARAPGHSNIGPSLHLDLVEANRRQLLDAGVAEDAIFVSGECTSCQTGRYFSHRAEHGFTGRMMSVIGVRG